MILLAQSTLTTESWSKKERKNILRAIANVIWMHTNQYVKTRRWPLTPI